MILVPGSLQEVISKDYLRAVKIAEEYRSDNLSAIQKWMQWPESFGWHMLVCDIHDRHQYYNSWVEFKDLSAYFNLFNLKAFDDLFFKHMKFCGSKQTYGEFEVAEVVVTYGDTAPAVLFQSIGTDAIDKFPGFFGNFFIPIENITRELKQYNSLMAKQDRNRLVQRGAEFYNTPCNNNEDYQITKEILNAFPKALQYASKRNCGLLGLVVTAG